MTLSRPGLRLMSISVFLSALGATFSLDVAAKEFDNEVYIEKCGGKVYPKCDSEKLNHETIFKAAQNHAINEKKVLIINVGADWCPPCHALSRLLAEDKGEAKKLKETYVYVKMNADAQSFKALEKQYGWPKMGFPNLQIIDPNTGRSRSAFYPSAIPDLAGIQAEIVSRLKASDGSAVAAKVWFPTKDFRSNSDPTKSIRMSLLNQDIALDPRNLRVQQKFTAPLGKDPKSAADFYRQGLTLIHAFSWVDAARSLRKAIQLDSDFVAARIGLQKALIELGIEEDLVLVGNLSLAEQSARARRVSSGERAWLAWMKIETCLYLEATCERLQVKLKEDELENGAFNSRKALARSALTSGDIDVAAILAQGNLDGILDEAYKLDPLHIGVNHYLIHSNESANEYQKAKVHAEIFARNLAHIPHAFHMYGHLLPKLGAWKEAVMRFESADRGHLEWFKINQAKPWEDWHYAHNLDLLAHAYYFGGELGKAEAAWRRLCVDMSSGFQCSRLVQFLTLRGRFDEAKKVVANQYRGDPKSFMGQYMATYRNIALAEIGLIQSASQPQALKQALGELEQAYIASGTDEQRVKAADEGSPVFLFRSVIGFKGSKEEAEKIVEVVRRDLLQPGFDSWSEAVLEADKLSLLADRMGLASLAASIRLTKEAVGMRCR